MEPKVMEPPLGIPPNGGFSKGIPQNAPQKNQEFRNYTPEV